MIKYRQVIYGLDVREKIKRGVDALANTVRVTLGPHGRNVLFARHSAHPSITKDGVSVAEQVHTLKCPFETVVCDVVREASQKTCAEVGDGTTTSTVIAQSIVTLGLKELENNPNINLAELKTGILQGANYVAEELNKMSTPCKTRRDIERVATISANGDKSIGNLVSRAIKAVGSTGTVDIIEGVSRDDQLELVQGLEVPAGYMSPYFITNHKRALVELEDCFILTLDEEFNSVEEFRFFFDKYLNDPRTKENPVLIVCHDAHARALAPMIRNNNMGVLRCAVVKAPGYDAGKSEYVKDIAVSSGALFYQRSINPQPEKLPLEALGFAKKVIISSNTLRIIEGNGSKKEIEARAAEMKEALDKFPDDKEEILSRISKLEGKAAIIKTASMSEIEFKEKRDRIEDAVYAAKAAVAEGIVPGGGVALVRARKTECSSLGEEILMKACLSPAEQIITNSGGSPAELYSTEYPEDVIDPVKVVKTALKNGASIASTLLTTESIIADRFELENKG